MKGREELEEMLVERSRLLAQLRREILEKDERIMELERLEAYLKKRVDMLRDDLGRSQNDYADLAGSL